MIESMVDKREIGDLGISIGTSLGLQGALGTHPDLDTKGEVPLLEFSNLWVNVATLVRNLISCVPSANQIELLPSDIAVAIVNEIDIISASIQAANSQMKCVFYINDVEGIEEKLPNLNLWQPKTDRQKIIVATVKESLRLIVDSVSDVDFRLFKYIINPDMVGNTLMISHKPLDLMSNYRFDQLSLLESHTGVIKSKFKWGSKLGIKDETIPFNLFTLHIFGDGNVDISSARHELRKITTFMIKDGGWNATTTMARIRQSIQRLKEKKLKEELLELHDSKLN